MKTFKFGEDTIVYNNDFEFFHPLKLQLLNNNIDDVIEDFRSDISRYSKPEALINNVPAKAQKIIDNRITLIIKLLIQCEVYKYNMTSYKTIYSEKIDYKSQANYQNLCSSYKDIGDIELDLKTQRAYERASRSQISGGGFGIGGAIKGMVTAGAMNAALNSFRGVGDTITNVSDKGKINTLKKNLVNSNILEGLTDDLVDCLNYVDRSLFYILEEETGKDASLAIERNLVDSYAIFENAQSVNNKKQLHKMFKQIMELDPYFISAEYAILSSYDYFDISYQDARDLISYINPHAMYRWDNDEFNKAYSKLSNLTIVEKADRLYDIGIKYNFITTEYAINRDTFQRAAKAAAILDEIIFLRIKDQCRSDLTSDSIFLLKQEFDKLVNILHSHNILSCDPEELNIVSFENVDHLCKTFRMYENQYQKNILNYLETIEKNARDHLIKVCAAHQCIFEVLENNQLFLDELIKEEEFYLPGKSLADYESTKLSEIVEKLKSLNFKHELILQDIKKLEERVEFLKNHEESDEYKLGKILISNFETITSEKLYKYGDVEFVNKINKIKNINEITKYEKDIFPIIIFDKKENSNEFTGLIVSENYIYTAKKGSLEHAIDFKSIDYFSYNEDRNIIEIHCKNKDIIPIRIKELSIKDFSNSLSKTLSLPEPSEFEIPLLSKYNKNRFIIGGISTFIIVGLFVSILVQSSSDLETNYSNYEVTQANYSETELFQNNNSSSINEDTNNPTTNETNTGDLNESTTMKLLDDSEIIQNLIGTYICDNAAQGNFNIAFISEDNLGARIDIESWGYGGHQIGLGGGYLYQQGDSKIYCVDENGYGDMNIILDASGLSIITSPAENMETMYSSLSGQYIYYSNNIESLTINNSLNDGTYILDKGEEVFLAIVAEEDNVNRIKIQFINYGGDKSILDEGYLNVLGYGVYILSNYTGTRTLISNGNGFSLLSHDENGEIINNIFDGTYTYYNGDISESEEDNNDFIFPDSDKRYLTSDDVAGMDVATIRLAINEIYARHGRVFETEDLNEYFSSKSWYTPMYSQEEFDAMGDSIFNDYEKKNIEFLASVRDGLSQSLSYFDSSITMEVVNCNTSITLRSAPDTSADEICQIPLGCQVEAIGSTNNGFTYIHYAEPRVQGIPLEFEGYVLSQYLSSN